MQTGTKISGVMHLGAIGLALFGGALFKADGTKAIQISEVSIISAEDFAAMQSTSPAPSPDVATAPKIETPDSKQETTPKIEQADPTVPDINEQVAMIAPVPIPAPRIDTTSAPKPDINATEAKTPQQEVAPDKTGTDVAKPAEAQAPKEAATVIVTEADKPSEYAPTTSTLPPKRPRDMAKRVAKINAPKPDKPVKKAKDTTAVEIAKALAEAQNNKPVVPLGPPLTGGERAGLVLAVQKCWNVPIGLQNADNLVVVIAMELTPDGKLAGNPKLIDPAGPPTGTIKQAFEAGRRALIRCAPYDLPREKYEQWRQVEVVFNPEKMAVR
ncbi:MAG: hypothetical protein QM492_09900 [Rhodobacterales bacterium]